MTNKLYYENPELRAHTVAVLQNEKDSHGDYVVLDQTIFYPEGGGQPNDLGTINGVNVYDVQTVRGEIRHYIETPLPLGTYQTELDWARRWDHMQQHAGQHVLSAVFDDVYQMKTSSFHLGKERVSIDLNAPEITGSQLEDVEKRANAVIRRHLPIQTQWVTQEQAAEMNLRKPPAVDGPIRLVIMDGVDTNACGGTHPLNTADIETIKIISTEKSKGGTRVYFLCGTRAMHYFQQLIRTTDELVRQLNAPLPELVAAADALLQEKAANEKTIKDLRAELLEVEAASFMPDPAHGTVEKLFRNRPIKEIQQLARLAISRHPSAHLLFLGMDGEDMRFVCAKGTDAPGDMREALKELLALTAGKGGGNEQLGQGGGKTDKLPETFFQVFRSSVQINK
ncbi:alanyl-tRNA editing protein [Planococcus sp. YIM B11945]|uniref:alanyl-tRNA editing protein n=1 Tax=Planococcus sp. YIM B11945 TaxID=3435410 RepID=UPI003D7D1912